MKFTILSGSSRSKSQSSKISHFIQARLRSKPDTSTYFLDLAGNPLPLWDESIWEGAPAWKKAFDPIKTELQSSDAFVFVVPEWGGMVPSAVKNFFLLCSVNELGHKPALIVSISSARGGTYPVAELRMSSYKNNRVVYIPEQLIVRDVEKMFNEGPATHEDDIYLRERLDYSLDMLRVYGTSLNQVRSSGILDHKKFPFGM